MDSLPGHTSDNSSSPDASTSSVVSRFTTPDLDGIAWDRRIEKPPAAWFDHRTIGWTAGGELPAMADRHNLPGMGQQRGQFGPSESRGQQEQQRQQTPFANSAHGRLERIGMEPGLMSNTPRFLDSLNWRSVSALGASDMAIPVSSAMNPHFGMAQWSQQQQQQQPQQLQQQQQYQGAVPGLDGFYAYCFDRGDGNYTRLIPADMLPPLMHIPSLQHGSEGMLVLPVPSRLPPRGPASNIEPVILLKTPPSSPVPGSDNIQKKIDHIVASSPTPQKKPKIYCDKWVHEGVCAFTQQGCKYKHEMPLDKATQMSLGLFHGLPAWWKKQQTERQREDTSGTLEAAGVDTVFCDKSDDLTQPLVLPGVPRPQQAMSWRRQDSASSMPLAVPPTSGIGSMSALSSSVYGATVSGLRSSDTGSFSRPTSSPTSPCAFGPIAPPSRFNGTESGQSTSYPAANMGRPVGGGTSRGREATIDGPHQGPSLESLVRWVP